MSSVKIRSILKYLQACLFLSALMYFGKALFIPLSFALLISLILYPSTRWLENKRWPRPLAILTSISLLFMALAGLATLLIYQLSQFLSRWPLMQHQLTSALAETIARIEETFELKFFDQPDYMQSMLNRGLEYLLDWLPNSLYSTAINLVLLFLVPFYVALILYYRSHLVNFLHKLTTTWSYQELKTVLADSIHTYYNFIKGVSIVYLIVGVLNSAGLMILGIPNAILFGFIASVLTFIPYIGITIGALVPVAVAWLTYDSLIYPMGVVAVFVFVQVLEANIIFPLVVSKHLRINALAAIVVIVLGGIIWGASGMILFLPFVAILKLVIDHVDRDHPISTLLEP